MAEVALNESASEFALTKGERQLLMELGMLAASNGLAWEAFRLFNDLITADPDAAYPRLGLAYCNMMSGQFDAAHKLLQEAQVVKSPLVGPAMALRALAYRIAGCGDACYKTSREVEKKYGDNDTLMAFVSVLTKQKNE